MKVHATNYAENWEALAKSLISGFYNHGFVNESVLGGDYRYFVRLHG